jgi:hypothetical protein
MDTDNKISKNETREVEDWRNEHGLPDFEYLRSLAAEGGPEATEKLKSIAEDLDADYDADASPLELVEMIRSATERNEDGDLTVTT